MKPSVLIGYITRAGYTREVARAVGQRMRDRGFDTDVADLELCIRHPERYDAVVLGCAVRFGHPSMTMARFIAEHRATLEALPTGFFSVDGSRSPQKHLDEFFQLTDWHPSRVLAVPGVQGARVRRAIAWIQDRLESKSVTRVEAPTDWSRIAAFADQVADVVRASSDRGAGPSENPNGGYSSTSEA